MACASSARAVLCLSMSLYRSDAAEDSIWLPCGFLDMRFQLGSNRAVTMFPRTTGMTAQQLHGTWQQQLSKSHRSSAGAG